MNLLASLKKTILLSSLVIAPLSLADENIIAVHKTETVIEIDGKATEEAWGKAQWLLMDKHIVGEYH